MSDETAVVEVLPSCDVCKEQATYDAKTVFGAWANLCQTCFNSFGIKLGLGYGQRLVVRENV